MNILKSRGQLLQGDKGTSPLVLLTLAATLLAVGLVASNYFVKSLNFHRQVFSKKNAVESQLEENAKTLKSLEKSFAALEKTGPRSAEILAALPTSNDFTNTSATLESIIQRSGMEIDTINLDSDTGETLSSDTYAESNPEVKSLLINVETRGSYDALIRLLNNLEDSRRVFRVEGVDLSGRSDQLKAVLTVSTFFQPAIDNKIETKEFRYENN